MKLCKIDKQTIKSGIYVYRSLIDGTIFYVGRDAALFYNKRHEARINNRQPDKQQALKSFLQKNPNKLLYEHFAYVDQYNLPLVEEALIRFFRPQFNYEFLERMQQQKYAHKIFLEQMFKRYNISETDKKQVLAIFSFLS